MRFIDMFAGIGGFHLGMEQAGHQCRGRKMSRIIGLIDVNLECIKILEGDTRYYSFQVGKPFEYHDGPNESPIIIGIERKNDCYYLYAEGKHTFVAPANNYIAEYVEDEDA